MLLQHVARRLVWMLVALLGVSVITFVIAFLLPGDPARVIAGPLASNAVVQSIRHQLGLDQPLYVQYVQYLWRALHGDLGLSYRTQQEVLPTIWARFPYTLAVALGGLVVELVVGVSLGIVAAVKQGKLADGVAMTIALVKMILIILYFMHVRYSGKLTWLASTGAILFFLLLVVGLLNDYWTRMDLQVPGK